MTRTTMLSLLSEFLGREVTMAECKQAELDQTEQWYASGMTDFSVYSHEKSLLACASYTVSQSLTSIERLRKYLAFLKLTPSKLLDHGCGLGLTTLRLGQLYPRARVLGTNVPGVQAEFNKFLLSKFSPRNVEFIDERRLDTAGRVDVLVTLEVFEHFQRPLVELRHLIGLLRPRLVYEASGFALRCTGHFDEYDFDGRAVPGAPSRKGTMALKRGFVAEGYTFSPHAFFGAHDRFYLDRQLRRKIWGTGKIPSMRRMHPTTRWGLAKGELKREDIDATT